MEEKISPLPSMNLRHNLQLQSKLGSSILLCKITSMRIILDIILGAILAYVLSIPLGY